MKPAVQVLRFSSRVHERAAVARDTGTVHRALRQRIDTFEDMWREA